MPELVLLSIDKAAFKAAYRAAADGDESALHELLDAWAGYADRELACFVCDAVTANPPYSFVLPERGDPRKAIAIPLCPACAALPTLQRQHRVTRLLKKMWTRPGGPQVHFQLTPRRR